MGDYVTLRVLIMPLWGFKVSYPTGPAIHDAVTLRIASMFPDSHGKQCISEDCTSDTACQPAP